MFNFSCPYCNREDELEDDKDSTYFCHACKCIFCMEDGKPRPPLVTEFIKMMNSPVILAKLVDSCPEDRGG